MDLIVSFTNNYPEKLFCEKIKNGFAKKFDSIFGFKYNFENGNLIKSEKIQFLVSDELVKLLIEGLKPKDGHNTLNDYEVILDNLIFIYTKCNYDIEKLKAYLMINTEELEINLITNFQHEEDLFNIESKFAYFRKVMNLDSENPN
ncbi:hypothetical protein MsAg5_04470 [Methanosarcinaceae archaeon Ag5]|uniref:Uncharacterized protein n=2 Tax=Methanolapillus africanus TaxID=3028297 RepID=A0AAE4MIQ5_9EURY|nr:hypothetical protein [Methanosarcinaceae archaeon Ag5]